MEGKYIYILYGMTHLDEKTLLRNVAHATVT